MKLRHLWGHESGIGGIGSGTLGSLQRQPEIDGRSGEWMFLVVLHFIKHLGEMHISISFFCRHEDATKEITCSSAAFLGCHMLLLFLCFNAF